MPVAAEEKHEPRSPRPIDTLGPQDYVTAKTQEVWVSTVTSRVSAAPADAFGPFRAPPQVLVRPRLLDRLKEAEARRLTLIVADSGYGKSTLLAQWGGTVSGTPQAWYALRSRDALLRDFERHLTAALGRVVSLHRPARSLQEALDGVETNALLVLDDLQHLTDRGLALLKDLLEHPLMHLVAASRVPPALPLARLRIQGQIVELTATDLAFTPEEVAALGLEGDPEELWRQTQGWPAAFAVIPHGGLLRTADNRTELFTLLAEEVWLHLSPRERRILETVSVAGTVPAEFIRELRGDPGAGEVLENFARRGWVSTTAPDRYQCHSLFREFVLQRMDPQERAGLAEHAVRWWTARGEPTEAGGISTLCTPRIRWEFMATHGATLTRHGGAVALGEALDGLDYDPQEPPDVTALRGRLENLEGRFGAALEWLVTARERASQKEDWRTLARVTAFMAEILSHRGEYARAADICRDALSKIAGRDARAQAEVESILPWSLFHLGEVDEALSILERARRWYQEHGIAQAEALCIRRRGAFHSMRGELAEALRWEGLAVARFRQVRDPLGEANACMNLGVTLTRAGRYEEGGAQIHTALAVAERHRLTGIIQDIRRELAGLAAEAGGEVGPPPPALESEREHFFWHLATAQWRRRRGEMHQAWQALGAARALLPALSAIFRARLEAEEGALRLMQDEGEPALRLLEPAVEALWDGPWRVNSYLPRLHRAYARLRTGDERGARADLDVLFAWRTQADLGTLWSREIWAARPVLEVAVRTRLEAGFAAALLRMLSGAPHVAGVPSVRVEILGPLRVVRHGVELGEEAFDRPQVRALLGYLALHHPRPVPAAELVEALWLQATSVEASGLYTTVSRLRRTLGRDAVIKDGTGYRLGGSVEVDTAAFDQALTARPPRWTEALALWRGDLFADLPQAEWCFLARETYRSRFLDAAVRYAEVALAQKDGERAREAFTRALQADAFCEPAVQGLMRVLALMGDAPRALRLFRRFADDLDRELGAAPSEETLRLAQRLAG